MSFANLSYASKQLHSVRNNSEVTDSRGVRKIPYGHAVSQISELDKLFEESGYSAHYAVIKGFKIKENSYSNALTQEKVAQICETSQTYVQHMYIATRSAAETAKKTYKISRATMKKINRHLHTMEGDVFVCPPSRSQTAKSLFAFNFKDIKNAWNEVIVPKTAAARADKMNAEMTPVI